MSSSPGRPNYFDSFKPNRVEQGEAISREEMIRRLAHYLQVPQRFGYRLMLAYEDVMFDALQHREGIKFKGAGTLTLERHKNDTYTGLGRTAKRKVLYKYVWSQSAEAKRFLKKLSEEELNGNIQDTED